MVPPWNHAVVPADCLLDGGEDRPAAHDGEDDANREESHSGPAAMDADVVRQR